jgi:hypothetical protein
MDFSMNSWEEIKVDLLREAWMEIGWYRLVEIWKVI